MENEKTEIITEDHIANLSRRARIALAARCCQRVQPLYKHAWPSAPQEHLDAIDTAISQAINYCTDKNEFSLAEIKDALETVVNAQSSLPSATSNLQHVARSSAQNTCIIINGTIQSIIISRYTDEDNKTASSTTLDSTLYNTSFAIVNGQDEDVTKKVLGVVQSIVNLFSVEPTVNFSGRMTLEEAVNNDVTALLEIEKGPWPDDPPVSHEFFNNLWPNGEPIWPNMEPLQ